MPPTCCHSPPRTLLSHLPTYVSPTLVPRCLQSFYLPEPASNPLSAGKPPLVSMAPCSFGALTQWDHAACVLLILTPKDLCSPAGELPPQTRSSWWTELLLAGGEACRDVGRGAAVYVGWIRPQDPRLLGKCASTHRYSRAQCLHTAWGERKKKTRGNCIKDKVHWHTSPPFSCLHQRPCSRAGPMTVCCPGFPMTADGQSQQQPS